MRKLMLLCGYLAVLCTVLFPFFTCCHCTGGNILLWAAFVLFSICYAPLLFIQRNKTADTTIKKIFNVLVLVTMFIAGCAVITKHFHYGCAQGLACATYTLIILAILMQIWMAIKEPDPAKSNCKHNRSMVMAIVLVLFVMLQISTLPRNIMDEFNCVTANQSKEIAYFDAKAKSFFDNFDKNAASNPAAEAYYMKAKEVMAKSDSLIAYVKNVGEDMIFLAEKQKISFDSIENIHRKADRKSVAEVLYKQKKDSLINANMKAYATFVGENTNSRGKEILDIFFPGSVKDTAKSCKMTCKTSCKSDGKDQACCGGCCTCTLICQLSTFYADVLHIRMVEAETLNYLQTMQAKALMREAPDKK
jgi:hypothetical protein